MAHLGKLNNTISSLMSVNEDFYNVLSTITDKELRSKLLALHIRFEDLVDTFDDATDTNPTEVW